MPPSLETAHILIVDDDVEVRAMLHAALAGEGFHISEAASGAEMMAAINTGVPHLITLDLNLHGEDGLRLAREVRARIRAVLRRYAHEPQPATKSGDGPQERYRFDGWILDIPRRELKTPSGELCDLTTAEFDLLSILVKRPGRVLSRDNIMDLLKGQDWSPLDNDRRSRRPPEAQARTR